ncbi:MAG: hypothetical protein QM679_01795 [Patulibacter sp.]
MANLNLEACGLPSWDALHDVYGEFEAAEPILIDHWLYARGSTGQEHLQPLWLERAGVPVAAGRRKEPAVLRGMTSYGVTRFDRPIRAKAFGEDGRLPLNGCSTSSEGTCG